MKGKKLRVGIIFGGRSAEHEVSLRSARSIFQALDKSKFDPVLIGITKQGMWQFDAKQSLLSDQKSFQLAVANQKKEESTALVPQQKDIKQLDVIFPVLHGSYGEDGTVQGLLKLAGIPYVGADVLGSAIGMDKDVMKRLLQQAKIPIAKYVAINKGNKNKVSYTNLKRELGTTFFVKPANLGSSVGVHKVSNERELKNALDDAFQYDNKVLIEQNINAREIECAVLGNDEPIASHPGEVIVHHEFYSYEAKYLDPDGADFIIPAKIPTKIKKKIQELAIKTFQVLCCQGMARVDFFLTEENEILVNEINTIPGFTSISMYPKMWEASGISYTELVTKLIELAIQRHMQNKNLKTSFV